MKTLKKNFKFILCFLAFAVLSVVFAFSPVLTTLPAYATAEAKTYAYILNSVHLPKKVVNAENNEQLIVPLLTLNSSSSVFSNTTKYTVRVIDPSGYNHDCEVSNLSNPTTTNSDYFEYHNTADQEKHIPAKSLVVKGLNNGDYDILYIVKDETHNKTYYSNKYSVTVKNVSYELDFTAEGGDNAGLKQLVPSEVALNDEKIALPVAYVKQMNKDDAVSVSTIKKPSKTIFNGGTNVPEGTIVNESDGTVSLNPTKEGVYTFEYTYDGANRPTKTFTVRVTDGYKKPTEKDIAVSTPSLTNAGFELGKKGIKLPNVTVTLSKNGTVIEHNVVSIDIVNQEKPEIKTTLNKNNFTFDMTKETFNASSYDEMSGYYDVIYHIEDAYGNLKTKTVTVRNVTDNTKPEVFLAYNYALTEDAEWENGKLVQGGLTEAKPNTDYAPEFKAQFKKDSLYFPAIYATDLTSELKDFTFVRYFQNRTSGNTFYIDNLQIVDGEVKPISTTSQYRNAYGEKPGETETDTRGQMNKVTKFRFTDEIINSIKSGDEYTLYYYVIANNKQESYVYESGTTRYTFKIVDSEAEETPTPTITLDNVRAGQSINIEDEMNVNVIAKDEDGKDTRIKTQLFYYYGKTSDGTDKSIDAETMKGYFESALTATVGTQSTYITNFTSNVLDNAELLTKWRTNSDLDRIYAVTNNSETANNYKFNFEKYVVGQGTKDDKVVTLFAVSINDYGKVGIDVKTFNINNTTESNAPVVSKIELPSYDGGLDEKLKYWTSTDNDTLVVTGRTDIKQGVDVELPTVTFSDENGDGSNDKTLALNVMYYINVPESDAGLQFLSTKNKKLTGANSDEMNIINGGKITTTQVGDYYVVYTATDDAGNQTSVYFTFKVVDSSNPLLYVGTLGENLSRSGDTISAETGAVITFVPSVFSADGVDITNDTAVYDYVVEENGLDYESTGEYLTYKFNDEGTYTFVFNAHYTSDETRKADTKTIRVKITRPELAWENEDEINIAQNAELSSEIILPDLIAKQGNIKAVAVPKVTDPDGNEISVERVLEGSSEVWKFSTTSTKGTYVVSYTAKTNYGSITKEYRIKVGDNAGPTITYTSSVQKVIEQEIVYGNSALELRVDVLNLNTSDEPNKMVVKLVKDGKTIYEEDLGLTITDYDDEGLSSLTDYMWGQLLSNTELISNVSSNINKVESDDTHILYNITGAGEYTLRIKTKDRYDNFSDPIEFTFKVVAESTNANTVNDTVVGIVLIVISLIILAGVILFFTFTGKKGGTRKPKAKKVSKETETVEEKAEESEASVEVKDETEGEAKSGDVE